MPTEQGPNSDPKLVLSASSGRDLASILSVPYDRFVYHLFKLEPHRRYVRYSVAKRAGGVREILAPNPVLKRLQRRLLPYLQALYLPKACVHGFVEGRNVLTNAQQHVGKRYVMNVDLADFFPSVNSGRILGMLKGNRYRLHPDVASFITRLCTFDNHLPQGAPTSPLLSNMVCSRLDDKLQFLARKHSCTYTRYADDITFSSNAPEMPEAFAFYASVGSSQKLVVGDELAAAIYDNGFSIQPRKVRLQHRTKRQEVTGVVVNLRPNLVRAYSNRLRAMLHAWEKYGHDAAQSDFHTRFNQKHRPTFKEQPPFHTVVRGKLLYLRMIRGETDPQFLRLMALYDTLWQRDVQAITSSGTTD